MEKLPYIEIDKRKNTLPAHYIRRHRGGKKVRLPDPSDQQAYLGAYYRIKAELEANPPRKSYRKDKRRFAWLIEQYKQSSSYEALKHTTRRTRESSFKHIEERFGEKALNSVSRRDVIDAMEDMRLTPAAANNFLVTLRTIVYWGIDNEHINTDCTLRVKKYPKDKIGYRSWTEEDVELFRANWAVGSQARLALELLYYTGCRVGDLIRLGPKNIHKDGDSLFLEFSTEKTRQPIKVYIPSSLEIALDSVERIGDTFLYTPKSKRPFQNSKEFGKQFDRWCEKCGITKTGHGLRKTAAELAANEGLSPTELQSIFGWSTLDMPNHYTKQMNRRELAAQSTKHLHEDHKNNAN